MRLSLEQLEYGHHTDGATCSVECDGLLSCGLSRITQFPHLTLISLLLLGHSIKLVQSIWFVDLMRILKLPEQFQNQQVDFPLCALSDSSAFFSVIVSPAFPSLRLLVFQSLFNLSVYCRGVNRLSQLTSSSLGIWSKYVGCAFLALQEHCWLWIIPWKERVRPFSSPSCQEL